MKYGKEIVLLALAAFAALAGAAMGEDYAFRAHMWVLFFALAGGTLVLMGNVSWAPATSPASIPLRSDEDERYLDGPIRYGAIATVFWAGVGLLVGVIVAVQLAFPQFNFEPWFTFGRVRPLHTSAVIFRSEERRVGKGCIA